MKILVQLTPDSTPIDLGIIGDYSLFSSQWLYTLRAEMDQMSRVEKDFAEANDGHDAHSVTIIERDGIATTLRGARLKLSIRHDHIAFLATASARSINLNQTNT
jgi:hypothetical protein